MRPLFTLGSVYSTTTRRAEHKSETNSSLAGGKPLPTYMRGRGFELGATVNRGSGHSGTRTRDRRIGAFHFLSAPSPPPPASRGFLRRRVFFNWT